MRNSQILARYGISVFVSLCLFVAINYMNFKRPRDCADCFYLYGVPFTFFREGGFVSIRELIWGGVVADLLVVMACAAALAWAWSLLLNRRSTSSPNTS